MADKTPSWEVRLHLHVPSNSPFFVPFKNEFNTPLWSCLHVTLERSKVPLTKTETFTVSVNKLLSVL